MQKFSGKEIIRIRSELVIHTGVIPVLAFDGKI